MSLNTISIEAFWGSQSKTMRGYAQSRQYHTIVEKYVISNICPFCVDFPSNSRRVLKIVRLTTICNGPKWTISVNGGLRLL